MKVIEFFSSNNKEHWKTQIQLADWAAANFLVSLLNDTQKFDALLGHGGKLYMLVEGEQIVSFVTLTHQDCIRDEALFPWLGFLFTYPEYRGKRYSEKLIRYVEEEARAMNHPTMYLATDHVDLYEKYGFIYLETREDYWGDDSRIYYKKL